MAKKKKVEQEENIQEEPEQEFDDDSEVDDQEQSEVDPRIVAIRAAFVEGVDAELDEDSIKLKMIQAGSKFSEVARLYNLYLVEFGFAKSKEEKNAAIEEILPGQDLLDESVFDACSIKIMEALEVTDKSANAMIRQWCKKNDVEYFKKVREPVTGTSSIVNKVFDWIIVNIDSTHSELVSFLETFDSANVIKRKSKYVAIFDMAKSIKAKYTA